jgi:lysophospholipase L1-like esterase
VTDRSFFIVLGAVMMLAACGGSPTAATTSVTDPPSIACPIAPAPVESLDGSVMPVTYTAPVVTGGLAPINTSCLPISGSSFPVGTTTVTCTTSDARARNESCTFPVVVQPPPTLSTASFLAFGDSITWGEDGRDAANLTATGQHVFVQLVGQTYPDALQAELKARYRLQSPPVANWGRAGETLSDGLSSDCQGGPPEQSGAYVRYTQAVSSGRYGALLLMEGSNDVDGAPGDSCLLNKAIGVLRRIADDAKSRGIQVILATIPPMVPPGVASRTKGYQVVPTYNDMVRALGVAEGVPVADVYAAFGSDAPSLIGFDGLHPNASGYQRIADTFFAAIKNSIETKRPSSVAGRVSSAK